MTDKTIARPRIINFENASFRILLPENWSASKVSDNQILFTGPKVGESNLAIYISRVLKKNNSIKKIAAKAKRAQQKNKEYQLISEKDLSTDKFEAFMRRSTWYQEKSDMILFVREIFTTAPEKDIIVVSCCIPNSPQLKELDMACIEVMNTFRFR